MSNQSGSMSYPVEYVAGLVERLVDAHATSTCKTCRWWCGPESDADKPFCSILGDYKHMQRRLAVADVLSHPAHAWADHAYMFYCGPDFGCIHHSPLTPPEPTANNQGGETLCD